MNEAELQRGTPDTGVEQRYKHVVVWDPKDEYWEGAIVAPETAAHLALRGVALLPCIPELFIQAGFAGFSKRAWGSGWPLDGATPQPVCPMLVFYPGEPHRTVHWKARLVGKSGEGIPLRLSAGEGRGNIVRPNLQEIVGRRNAVDVAKLGEPDENGGWTVGGTCALSVASVGAYSVCLYGCAPGMRVVWLAATLTP
jgi:hypothetical protein